MPWPDDGAPTRTDEHLVEQYAPAAPAAVKRTAAAMVRSALPADAASGDRAGAPKPVDVSQIQDSGQGVSYRDPARANAIKRSGAAGVLAPYRRLRARKVTDD